MTDTVTHDYNDLVRDRLNRLCKPPGSLGDLESLAHRLCTTQQTLTPKTTPRRTVVFAADHGVTREGVTAWSSEVTASVVRLMQQQRTASGVFARALQCEYEVVDVGLLHPVESVSSSVQFINAAKRRGTGNLRCEPAMTVDDFDHVWQVGGRRAEAAASDGCHLVVGGEMGIGNTTSASCIVGLLADVDASLVVGRGAGIDDAGLVRKRGVVCDATDRVRSLGDIDAKQVGRQVGGLEIVALAGFYARAADLGLTIVLDGFIATAAAILAESIFQGSAQRMIAGHCSSEPGHRAALSHLGLTPLLDLNFRLGEATGALAALPLIDLAAAMINDMATLDDLENP